MALTWDEKYHIGHLTVDSDRRKLFEIADEFTRSKDVTASRRVLARLIDSAAINFAREEYVLQLCMVPANKLAVHRSCHNILKQSLRDVVLDEVLAAKRPQAHEFVRKTARLLEMWIFNHIIKDDLDVKPFVLKHIHGRDAARKAANASRKRA
jgi:hemerythrin-like metal-binding protein